MLQRVPRNLIILAHAVHDRLAHPFPQHHLGKGADKDQQHQQPVLEHDTAQALNPQLTFQICSQNIVVNTALHELGHNEGGKADGKRKQHGQR